jgi:hypothetical protein
MVDGDEDGDLAVLDRKRRGHAGSPHLIDRLRDDRAVVVARTTRAADPVCRRQASRIRRRTRSFEVRRPRMTPDLAVALAPNPRDQDRVGPRRGRGCRSAPGGWLRPAPRRPSAPAAPASPGNAADAADPGDTLAAAHLPETMGRSRRRCASPPGSPRSLLPWGGHQPPAARSWHGGARQRHPWSAHPP